MKSRFLIGLSALALLVLVSVQYIFITETYRTKQEQFDTRYGTLIREGLNEFNSQDFRFGLDSVLYRLDSIALEFLYADQDSLVNEFILEFYGTLSGFRQPEWFLQQYLVQAGEDPDFIYHIHLRELFLTDMGFQIQLLPDSSLLPPAPENALLAGSYTHERNFFRVSYDILVSFTNRSKMILKEMWLILALSVLTLVLVFMVFYITLRNMLRQKRLSEMKSDFINNMTHELKTPLSTISVASSSLGNPGIVKNRERVAELSGLIKRQNRHLSELIDRILDIHIWEKDQVRLKLKEVDLEHWITHLAEAFASGKGKEEAEIRVQTELKHPVQRMDEVHMSTMVNNLLSNAVKYGLPPCRIELYAGHQADQLVIRVTDNGPGIRKEEQKHIFEKFYRGEQPRQRVIRGLGLGLYYVKQIVEAHRGSVQVSSTPGEGTQFTIKIPVSHGSPISGG